MKLNAPRFIIWFIATAVGVLGIVSRFVPITFVSMNAFWFVAGGFALLVLATLFKHL
jgi:hypothetical protein